MSSPAGKKLLGDRVAASLVEFDGQYLAFPTSRPLRPFAQYGFLVVCRRRVVAPHSPAVVAGSGPTDWAIYLHDFDLSRESVVIGKLRSRSPRRRFLVVADLCSIGFRLLCNLPLPLQTTSRPDELPKPVHSAIPPSPCRPRPPQCHRRRLQTSAWPWGRRSRQASQGLHLPRGQAVRAARAPQHPLQIVAMLLVFPGTVRPRRHQLAEHRCSNRGAGNHRRPQPRRQPGAKG